MGRLSLTWLILIAFAVGYLALYIYSGESHHHIVFNVYLAAALIVTEIKKATKNKTKPL